VFLLRKNRSPPAPLGRKGECCKTVRELLKLSGMENMAKKKKGKGGRPAKNVKLKVRSGVRFSRTDFFIVKEKARKARMRILASGGTKALMGLAF